MPTQFHPFVLEEDLLYKEGLEKGLEKGLEQGLERGEEIKAYEIVLQMLSAGKLTTAEISHYTKVPEAKIFEIKAEEKHRPEVEKMLKESSLDVARIAELLEVSETFVEVVKGGLVDSKKDSNN